MNNYLKIIEEKIRNKISIEEIKIIDNSHKHTKHKFYNTEKYYLALEIKSNYLDSLSRLEAQRKVMEILKEDLKKKIHALEIMIK